MPAGQAPFCTYIGISGDYYSATTKVTASVRYNILLGANNTSEYNLLRNRVYNVRTTIQGQNLTDTRVQSVIDYTDNQTGWFLTATGDQPRLYAAADCAVACPEGYRVPTKQELFIMYAVKPATGMTYATESDYRSDNNTCLTMEGKNGGLNYRGTGGEVNATSGYKVRCLKDRVPAHREGMVIVALQNDPVIPSLGTFITSVNGGQNNGHVVGQGFSASAQNKNAYDSVRCVRDL